MHISILGIDIGKYSCSVVGVDDLGAVVVRRTMRRQTLIESVGKLPTCVIATCGQGIPRVRRPLTDRPGSAL